jgi:hypothetical protein
VRWISDPIFVPGRIGGMARLVHDCGSRAPQAVEIRVAAFFPLRGRRTRVGGQSNERPLFDFVRLWPRI